MLVSRHPSERFQLDFTKFSKPAAAAAACKFGNACRAITEKKKNIIYSECSYINSWQAARIIYIYFNKTCTAASNNIIQYIIYSFINYRNYLSYTYIYIYIDNNTSAITHFEYFTQSCLCLLCIVSKYDCFTSEYGSHIIITAYIIMLRTTVIQRNMTH